MENIMNLLCIGLSFFFLTVGMLIVKPEPNTPVEEVMANAAIAKVWLMASFITLVASYIYR